MDLIEDFLPDTINPNAFPAKLWRIVNDPTNRAVSWSSTDEAIVIDLQLFQRQILSPRDTFKTTNFSSIIRQLNLYGFRKDDLPNTNFDAVKYSRYYNPNFKQNHPELLANLKRLTVSNRLQGGLGVNVRKRGDSRENILKKSSSPYKPTSMPSTPSFLPSKSRVMDALSRTPIPPQYLRRGGSAAGSSVFVPAQQIPVSLSPQFFIPASNSNTMHGQAVLLTHTNNGNHQFPSFAPWKAQYQPDCSPTVCPGFHLSLVPPVDADLSTRLIPPQSYYQAGYPMNFLNFNQESQHRENQDTKNPDINLDAIFQRADEIMLTSPSALPVKVEPIKVPVTIMDPSSGTYKVMPCENNESSTTANPASAVPVSVPAFSLLPVVTYKQQESIGSVSEEMVKDAVIEISAH